MKGIKTLGRTLLIEAGEAFDQGPPATSGTGVQTGAGEANGGAVVSTVSSYTVPGLLNDSSSSAHTISLINGALISESAGRYDNYSLQLLPEQAISRAAMVPASTDFEFGINEPFTIELDAYFVSLPGGKDAFIGHSLVFNSGGWIFYHDAGFLTFVFKDAGQAVKTINVASGLTSGAWHHLAVTRDASNDYRLFVNGALLTTVTNTSAMYAASSQLLMGNWDAHSNFDMRGYIDEVRVTKGVARYTAAFTRPSAPYGNDAGSDPGFASVVLLAHFTPEILDAIVTVSGAGSAQGSASVSASGLTIASASGLAQGASSVQAIPSGLTLDATGDAAGLASANAAGAMLVPASGQSDAGASASGTGATLLPTLGQADAGASASASGQAIVSAVARADALASVDGQSPAAVTLVVTSAGNALGVSSADASANAIVPVTATSAANASANAVGVSSASAIASSAAESIVNAFGAGINSANGQSNGSATVLCVITGANRANSDASSSASAAGQALIPAYGLSATLASAKATSQTLKTLLGLSSGTSGALGAGQAIEPAQGLASGSASAQAIGRLGEPFVAGHLVFRAVGLIPALSAFTDAQPALDGRPGLSPITEAEFTL